MAKIKQSAYYFHVKHKKTFLAVLTLFLTLGKTEMAAKIATIVGDVTGPQQRHQP